MLQSDDLSVEAPANPSSLQIATICSSSAPVKQCHVNKHTHGYGSYESKLVERRPAMVLLTGDFIYRPAGLTFFPWADELNRRQAESRTDKLIQQNLELLQPPLDTDIPVSNEQQPRIG